MTPSEFNRVAKEMLLDTWGEKSYPPGVLQKLWGIVGEISMQEFKYGLEQLSLTHSRAPAIGQIRGACLPAIQKAAQAGAEARIKRLESKGIRCDLCDNGGYVWVIPFDDPLAEGVFICTCEAAKVRGFLPNHKAEYWRPELVHKYFVRRFTASSLAEGDRLQKEAYAKVIPLKVRASDVAKEKIQKRKEQIEKLNVQVLAGQVKPKDVSALIEAVKQPQEESVPGIETVGDFPW